MDQSGIPQLSDPARPSTALKVNQKAARGKKPGRYARDGMVVFFGE